MSTNGMVLTRHFKETLLARLERDPEFRRELLKEGIDSLLLGDVDAAKVVLRDYINATIGFPELGRQTRKSPKSPMRMFGPDRNPRTQYVFEIIGCLQRHERVQFKVESASEQERADAAVNVSCPQNRTLS